MQCGMAVLTLSCAPAIKTEQSRPDESGGEPTTAPDDATMQRREPLGSTAMLASADFCWAKALEFTRRAEETTDNEVRDFFYRLRDVWVKAANDRGLVDGGQAPAAEPAAPVPPALPPMN